MGTRPKLVSGTADDGLANDYAHAALVALITAHKEAAIGIDGRRWPGMQRDLGRINELQDPNYKRTTTSRLACYQR